MKEDKERPINQEQTPEEIREVLIKAKNEKLPVDLVIRGKSADTTNMIIDNIEGGMVYVSYIHDDGGIGELIPLEILRIKSVKISYGSHN